MFIESESDPPSDNSVSLYKIYRMRAFKISTRKAQYKASISSPSVICVLVSVEIIVGIIIVLYNMNSCWTTAAV